MIRKAVLALAMLLLPAMSHAQNTTLIKGQKPDGSVNTAVQLDQNGKTLVNGSVYRLESTSLFNTTVTAGQAFKTNTPMYAQDISSVTMLMSWAAADSDSVAFEVFLVGKVSGNAADGLDYLIDMNPATKRLDGVLVGGSRYLTNPIMTHAGQDTLAGMGLVWAPSQYLPTITASAALGVPVPAQGATPVIGWAGISSNAVAFSVCPRGTSPPNFSYYSFWLLNLSPTKSVTNVTLLGLVRND